MTPTRKIFISWTLNARNVKTTHQRPSGLKFKERRRQLLDYSLVVTINESPERNYLKHDHPTPIPTPSVHTNIGVNSIGEIVQTDREY